MKAKETYKELKKDAQSNLAVTNKKIRSIVFLRLITFLFTSLFISIYACLVRIAIKNNQKIIGRNSSKKKLATMHYYIILLKEPGNAQP